MRRALIVVAAVALFLVGADLGLRALAQYWIAGQIQTSFELRDRPSVSLGGFPFLPRLITGKFPEVRVRSRGTVKTGRFPLSGVDLTLRQVRFPADQLLFGNKATIRAEGGSGTVTLTEDDINRAFPATVPVTIHLRGEKVRIESSIGTVETRLRVSDNRLLLEPVEGSLPVEVRVALPLIVRGITYTGVGIERSRALLRFRLTRPSILVG
jgi:LmeA-like phospholipid-binding